jgi:hypothetical protein
MELKNTRIYKTKFYKKKWTNMAEEKYFTQQWVNADVSKLIHKTSLSNPEFDVHFEEIEWHEDGDLVKIRLTFRNCGKNVYIQRIFAFLIKALWQPK